jgi:hypothetical protein
MFPVVTVVGEKKVWKELIEAISSNPTSLSYISA